MKKSKLINYTTQDFVSEKELELKLFRWNNIKDKYLPKLKANGILRIVTTKVWNKEGVSRLGHLFEYEDDTNSTRALLIVLLFLSLLSAKKIKSNNSFGFSILSLTSMMSLNFLSL